MDSRFRRGNDEEERPLRCDRRDTEGRGSPNRRWLAVSAAPNAPPASPAAGWIQRSSNRPSRNTLPLATQFSATPPARQRLGMPVSARSERVSRITASSITACAEAARSMCRCVNGSSGSRGGPPNSASNLPLVIVSPVQ